MNRGGHPTWDGRELKLYRRAMGVHQTDVAERIAVHTSAVSASYENTRSPVTVRFESIVKYLDAIERGAAWSKKDAAEAATELAALQATSPTKFADTPPGPQPKFRSRAEADAILRARGER